VDLDRVEVVEVDGAVPIGPVEILPGGWDMSIVSYTSEGAGPGKVTVSKLDGTKLLTIPFMRRERAERVVDLELSSVSLSEETLPAGVGATAELQIFPRNGFNELLGMDADVRLKGAEALHMTKPALSAMGFFTSTISASYYGGTYGVEVWVQDTLLATVNIEVVGPEAPGTPGHVSWPEGADVGSEPSDQVESTEAKPGTSSGCQTDQPHGPGTALLWFLAMLLLAGYRLRSRRVESR